MIFRLLFTAAVGDCYLNGPSLREEEKLVALACSIIAVLLNEQYAFILAEIAWFIVFARAGTEGQSTQVQAPTTVTTLEVTAAAPAKAGNQCPEPLRKALLESLEAFKKNREGDVSSDGTPWKLLHASEDGDKFWRAELPGKSIYRWRAYSTLYGPRSGVITELLDYSKRAGPNGWDKNMAKGRVDKEYDDNIRINVYSTNPVLGGVISPREFMEARIILENEPGNAYLAASIGLDTKAWQPIMKGDFPQADKSCTAAKSYPGCGLYLYPAQPGIPPETPQTWNIQLVICTEIGGWVPVATINSATAQVMQEAMSAQKTHMLKVFK